MKNISKTYVPKKSATLTLSQVHQYLLEVSNDGQVIVVKVAMILGIYGGLRVSEIASIKFEDVRKEGPNYIINIPISKTDQAGVGHEFTICPMPLSTNCPCHLLDSYISLFETQSGRLLRRLDKNGKPTCQSVGVNKVATFPALVASSLGIEGDFTGHCFRRSSATILADSGANLLQLKRHGRWKSSSVAEGYVDRSKVAKIELAKMINGEQSIKAVDGTKITGCCFTNCSVSIHFN